MTTADDGLREFAEALTGDDADLARLRARLDLPARPHLRVLDGDGGATPPTRPDLVVIRPDDSHKH
jgi:hypothetical protein